MGYFVTKVWKGLRWNFKLYSLIMIETMIAMMVLIMAFNVALSYQEKLNRLKQEANNAFHQINTVVGADGGKLPLTIEDYQYCRNELNPDGKVEYIYIIGEPTIYLDGNFNMGDFFFMFVTDEFYSHYLEVTEYDNEVIYGSADFIGWLDKSNVALLSGIRSIEFFQGKELKDITELNTNVKAYSPYGIAEHERPMEQCVIIPMKYYDELTLSSTTVQLLIKTDLKYLEEASYSVIQYLNNKQIKNINMINSTVNNRFELSNDTERFIQMSKVSLDKYKIATTYTSVALLIIIFGLGGILMLQVHRRKKEYAIFIMLGAKKTVLIGELFAEILVVMWFSTLMGTLLGYGLIQFEKIDTYEVLFYPVTILYGLAVTFMITVLGCILPFIMTYQLSPMQMLRRVE